MAANQLTSLVLCAVLSLATRGAVACDTTAATACITTATTDVASNPNQACDKVQELTTCFETAIADCDASMTAGVTGMFDMLVDPYCAASGACKDHAVCAGSGTETGSGDGDASGDSGASDASGCDLTAATACITTATADLASNADQACDKVHDLKTCFEDNTAGCQAGAASGVMTMFDTLVDPYCTANGACKDHTVCSGSGTVMGAGESHASDATKFASPVIASAAALVGAIAI